MRYCRKIKMKKKRKVFYCTNKEWKLSKHNNIEYKTSINTFVIFSMMIHIYYNYMEECTLQYIWLVYYPIVWSKLQRILVTLTTTTTIYIKEVLLMCLLLVALFPHISSQWTWFFFMKVHSSRKLVHGNFLHNKICNRHNFIWKLIITL